MVELKSYDDVEAWVNARPEATCHQDSIVLASRAALLVLPHIAPDAILRGNIHDRIIHSKLTEISFRAGATARRVALGPSRALSMAAFSATSSAQSAIKTLANMGAFPAAFSAARSAAYSADAAAFSAEITGPSVASSVAASAEAVTLSAINLAASSLAWEEISRNAVLIEELGAVAAIVAPLGSEEWLKSDIQQYWENMKHFLRALHKNEPVWIAWYERIMKGGTVSLAEEEVYVLLDAQEIWDQGLDAINDAIRERLERLSPPETPVSGEGPTIIVTPGGFDVVSQPATQTEQDDIELKSLHNTLLRRIKRIDESVQRLKNTHLPLHDEYADFAAFVSNDFKDIDVPTVWSAGTGLTDMVDRLEKQFERAKRANNQNALKDLPDELLLSQLQSLTRDFAGFIMGFDQAQKLALRSAELAKLNISKKDQAEHLVGVMQPMLNVANLLADKSRRLIGMLDRAIDGADEKTVAVLGAGTATASRAIIAFGKAVQKHPVLAMGVVVIGSPLDVTMKLSGDPNWETVRAAMFYLRDNADALATFANHDPVMRRWLDWLINEIRNADIPDG